MSKLLTFLLILLTFLTTTPHTMVGSLLIRLDRRHQVFKEWEASGYSGPLPSLVPVLGHHTSRPFISLSVQQCYFKALSLRYGNTLKSGTSLYDPSAVVEVSISESLSPELASRKLSSIPGILFAEPKPVHSILTSPNDSLYPDQYYLHLVRAEHAWPKIPDNREVVVAIVDTGVDTTHNDLRENIWVNVGETGLDTFGRDKRNNGVDDDSNGFIDDWFGWDFVGSGSIEDNIPLPGHLHGTHVAGIAGAVTNNHIGIAGTALGVKLMAIKVGSDNPSHNTVDKIGDAVLYAAAMGANVVNCSFGSPSFSQAEQEVFQAASDLGATIVAASGNNGLEMIYYPAGYKSVIAVGASTRSDVIASFSNYHRMVDIVAPGSSIVSCVPGNDYSWFDGTSLSTPIVSAVAAMTIRSNPALTPRHVKAVLLSSATNIDTLNQNQIGKFGAGRVDALQAVIAANSPRTYVDVDSLHWFKKGSDAQSERFISSDTLSVSFTLDNLYSDVGPMRIVFTDKTMGFPAGLVRHELTISGIQSGSSYPVLLEPFVVLTENLPLNALVQVLVEMFTADSILVGRRMLTATVNQSWTTLSRNDIRVTVNSSGNIGYNDFPLNTQGIGFSYRTSSSLLFEGALMISTGSGNVINSARGVGSSVKDTDFQVLNPISVQQLPDIPVSEATALFNDSWAPSPAGLIVSSRVYQGSADSVRNGILVCYTAYNTSRTETVDPFYLSLYLDWDIGPGGESNLAAWDYGRGIAYCSSTSLQDYPAVGVSMISDLPINFFAIDNDGITHDNPGVYRGFDRVTKWRMMSGGIGRAVSNITDVSMVLGGGPASIAPGDSIQVCFTLSAGMAYPEIVTATDALRAMAASLGMNSTAYTPIGFGQRFVHLTNSPALLPGLQSVTFEIDKPSFVSIDVVDLFGRTALPVFVNERLTGGRFTRSFHLPEIPFGTYFLRMTSYQGQTVFPFVVMR